MKTIVGLPVPKAVPVLMRGELIYHSVFDDVIKVSLPEPHLSDEVEAAFELLDDCADCGGPIDLVRTLYLTPDRKPRCESCHVEPNKVKPRRKEASCELR